MQLESLMDVFHHELQDVRDAERQLTEALPKMAQAASHEPLKEAFEHHLDETREHLRRVDEIIGQMGIAAGGETCEAMQGLVREGEEIVQATGDPAAKDAALISAAQRVEHYEIAAYGTLRTLADQLGLDDAKELLDQTLDEEGQADKLLTKIATGGFMKSGINERARS